MVLWLVSFLDDVMMNPDDEEKKSRSQLKREYEEVKDLVKALVDLSPQQLQDIPVSEGTRDAILAAQTMVRSPRKRQLAHLAGRMEYEDVAAIRSVLSSASDQESDGGLLGIEETWAEELVSGGDAALSLFVDEHPDVDRQHLRQLLRNARKQRKLDQPTTSAQPLLDYLRSFRLDES